MRRALWLVLLLGQGPALAQSQNQTQTQTQVQTLSDADRAALQARHGCEGGAMIAGSCEPANNATLVTVMDGNDIAALPLLPELDRVNVDPYLDLAALPGDPWHSLAQLPKLRRLSLSENRLHDLSPLTRLTNLRELVLAGTAVTDLTPLVGLPALRAINLHRTAISDLAPLRALPALDRLILPDGTILFTRAEVAAFLDSLP